VNNIKIFEHPIKGGDKQLSKNLKLSEVTCKCNLTHPQKVDLELVKVFQELRDLIGKPLEINSWYRCPNRNKFVGGARNSVHMAGNAVDLHVASLTREEIQSILDYCHSRRITAVHSERGKFIHVDTGVYRTWEY
jgi:uncharacterized protein YcbK (DUF882 family)